ncbi:MAG: hypothetical protein KAT74_03875, partial [Candidatus Cloacimonetes bacterium]|nr:hypothetical protein [Candidatus Cloacimonadota bacterium]
SGFVLKTFGTPGQSGFVKLQASLCYAQTRRRDKGEKMKKNDFTKTILKLFSGFIFMITKGFNYYHFYK